MLTALEEGNPSATAYFKFQAFTTAVVHDARIRGRIKAAIAGNLKRGEGERNFKKTVDAEFDKAGLTRLRNYQINNIYETNVSLAFGAGQMQKMLEVSDQFPYWKYSATLDSKTRPSHAALHGKIFKAGDFTFFPPIGFRCRCTAIPLTARQTGRYLKTDMPTPADKDNLYSLLESKEFAGNKQQKFMEWTAEQYKNAGPETRKLIDQAFDTMRQEIRNLKDDKPTFIPKELLEDSDYLKGTKIKFKDEFFRMIDRDKPIKLSLQSKGEGSKYDPLTKTVFIINDARLKRSQWFKESVIYHEFGHGIDWQRQLRNSSEIKQLIKSFRNKLMQNKTYQVWNSYNQKQTINVPEIAYISYRLDLIRLRIQKMDETTFQKRNMTKADVNEQILAIQDTLMAINPDFGYGHPKSYFKIAGKREGEFLAHCFENKFAGNPIFRKYLPDLYKAMCEFIEQQQKR